MEDKETAIKKKAGIVDNKIIPSDESEDSGGNAPAAINSSRKLQSKAITDAEKKEDEKKPEENKSDSKEKENQDEEHPESELASATERFLHYRFAPELLSHEGRIGIVSIYILSGLAAIYGCTQVRIDFSIDYFIGDKAYVKRFYDLND